MKNASCVGSPTLQLIASFWAAWLNALAPVNGHGANVEPSAGVVVVTPTLGPKQLSRAVAVVEELAAVEVGAAEPEHVVVDLVADQVPASTCLSRSCLSAPTPTR